MKSAPKQNLEKNFEIYSRNVHVTNVTTTKNSCVER